MTAADLLMDTLLVRLVVLSACETGLGKTLAGEDLQGLTRSFYLGCSLAVLSSLWPVVDEGARQFMNEFYQQFQNTKRFDQDWLAARNSLRKTKASPSVYGAFVLSGFSWDLIQPIIISRMRASLEGRFTLAQADRPTVPFFLPGNL